MKSEERGVGVLLLPLSGPYPPFSTMHAMLISSGLDGPGGQQWVTSYIRTESLVVYLYHQALESHCLLPRIPVDN